MGKSAGLIDEKRRVDDFTWRDASTNILVGYEYAHDDVNNPLYEKFKHNTAERGSPAVRATAADARVRMSPTCPLDKPTMLTVPVPVFVHAIMLP